MSQKQYIIKLYNERQALKREMINNPSKNTFYRLKQANKLLKREVGQCLV